MNFPVVSVDRIAFTTNMYCQKSTKDAITQVKEVLEVQRHLVGLYPVFPLKLMIHKAV